MMTTPGLAMMRAVQFDGYGDAEVLQVRGFSVPSPGPDEVLVRVHASGLNPKDVMIRSGAMRVVSGRTFPSPRRLCRAPGPARRGSAEAR